MPSIDQGYLLNMHLPYSETIIWLIVNRLVGFPRFDIVCWILTIFSFKEPGFWLFTKMHLTSLSRTHRTPMPSSAPCHCYSWLWISKVWRGCPSLDRRTIRVLSQSLWLYSPSCKVAASPNLEDQGTVLSLTSNHWPFWYGKRCRNWWKIPFSIAQ